tara:strand:+ start:5824 stop:6135 length:312 start_codon:yes stop_codon:yes gene_type:complete
MALTEITFFERFEADILAGKKTITIRDESEKHFIKDSHVKVSTYEAGRQFCEICIQDVQAIQKDQLSDFHAAQENMSLNQLKQVIDEIYPNVKSLYVISYQLL